MFSELTSTALLDAACKVPLQHLNWPAVEEKGIEVLVRRDDLVHPLWSGNKFYKLFYNLKAARDKGSDCVLSFGGAYSNHLHALAAAARELGFRSVGVVRGEEPKQLSSTLTDVQRWGMELCFVSRQQYREKASSAVEAYLRERHGDYFSIPEGGGNWLGAKGCMAIATATEQQLSGAYDAICVATGTGSTLAGIAAGLDAGKKVLGFSVLKGEGGLSDDVTTRLKELNAHGALTGDEPMGSQVSEPLKNWQLISGFHGGGYAKVSPSLKAFIERFEAHARLQLDPVYTAKLFWGIEQLALQGEWQRGTRLVVVHSGGLQGRRGYPQLAALECGAV